MNNQIMKVQTQQKTSDGMHVIHPETSAEIVVTSEIKDKNDQVLLEASNTQEVLSSLANELTDLKAAVLGLLDKEY